MTSAAPVVLVHGAWHGAWCWERVLPLLADRGIQAHAVDLPTCDPGQDCETTLHDDARTVRDALDALDRPCVLIGHSYGGMVITEAAAGHPNVAHLVYLTAFVPDAGESANQLAATTPNQAMRDAFRQTDDGRFYIDPALLGPLFYNDCDEATVQWARENCRTMRGGTGDAAEAAAWRDLPSTYVVCTQDRALLPPLQRRMAGHATDVVEWDTSHSPFASRPDLVAGLLERLARTAALSPAAH